MGRKGRISAASLLADFLAVCRLERGLSANTLMAYEQDVLRWLARSGFTDLRQLQDIPRRAFIDYMEAERSKGRAERTVLRRMMSLREFFRYLAFEKHIAESPLERIAFRAAPNKLPEPLTEEQAKRLVEAPLQCPSPHMRRDTAILEMLYATGARVSELLGLKMSDLIWQERLVTLTGKGDKQRLVPFGKPAAKALRAYIDQKQPENGEARIFPLTRVHIHGIVAHYAKVAGIGRRVYPHLLRHSCATHLLEHGASLPVIQAILGHASLTSTEIYTHVSTAELRKNHKRFHPHGKVA